MKSIEEKMVDSIRELNQKFERNPKVKDFEKINIEFESWVKKGIVKKRGNRLFPVSENHLQPQYWFNVPSKNNYKD